MTLPAMLTLIAWCIGIPLLAAWGKLRFWDWLERFENSAPRKSGADKEAR